MKYILILFLFVSCAGIQKNYGFTMPTHPRYAVMDEQLMNHLLLFLDGKYDLSIEEHEDIRDALVQALGTPLKQDK